MVPEYKPGETALINPLLPVMGGEVVRAFKTVHLLGEDAVFQGRRLIVQSTPPVNRRKTF